MKKIYYQWKDIHGAVIDIARQLQKDNWRPDYIVGLTRGGLIPAVMLSQFLEVPCETLKVSLRDSGECESNLWMAEHAFGYVKEEDQDPAHSETSGVSVPRDPFDLFVRKNILIVDDINDSGATLNWIRRDWEGGCLPQEEDRWHAVWSDTTRFAVLVDNQASEFGGINYSAEEINKAEEDCWCVFPWEEWWR